MRLASGIAPVRAYLDTGVPVGLGARWLCQQRLVATCWPRRGRRCSCSGSSGDPAGLCAEEALELATLGGAQVLGRDDIGPLTPGMAADFIGLRLDRLDYAGALHDPLAALIFCTPQRVDLSVINGRVVVKDGRLLTVDLGPVIERHNRIARELVLG